MPSNIAKDTWRDINEKTLKSVQLSNKEKLLLDAVDSSRQDLIELVTDLIKLDSRSYEPGQYSNLKPIACYISDFFNSISFSTKIYKCPHPDTEHPEREYWPNVVATTDVGDGKILQFNGHMDVVPFHAKRWYKIDDPLSPEVIDGRIYGRGAVDMKGGIAAQMIACKLFQKHSQANNGGLQVWYSPDEEMDGYYGVQYMFENHRRVVAADATIIAEPTGQFPIKNPALIVGEKGHAWMHFTVYGASGHGSMPKPKSNAVNKAVRFISNFEDCRIPKVKPPLSKLDLLKAVLSRYKLLDLIRLLKSMGNDDNNPVKNAYDEDGVSLYPFFNNTCSFTGMNGGEKVNVIPDMCNFTLDMRLLPGISKQEIIKAISDYCTDLGYKIEILGNYGNTQEGLDDFTQRPVDIELNIESMTVGTFVDPKFPFVKLMGKTFEDIYRVRNVHFFAPGGTDGGYMRHHGMKNVVVFGPPGRNAHTADEFVYVDQLIKACKMYLLTAYRLLVK